MAEKAPIRAQFAGLIARDGRAWLRRGVGCAEHTSFLFVSPRQELAWALKRVLAGTERVRSRAPQGRAPGSRPRVAPQGRARGRSVQRFCGPARDSV
jgi:hypothetical protein